MGSQWQLYTHTAWPPNFFLPHYNQFGGQEPRVGEDLYNYIHSKFKPTGDWVFLKKAHVKGDDATDLFKFLTSHEATTSLLWPNDIMWNYEKFLIGRDGVPIQRWRSMSYPNSMEA